MRCFYHHDREAVGSCKSCGKGLCPECAVDLTKGLACRGRCEADTRALIQLIDNNLQMQPTAARLIKTGDRLRLVGALFFLAVGAVFFLYGWRTEREIHFVTTLGICFLIYGLLLLLWSRRTTPRKRKNQPS
jgi:hypothetical protein